MRADHIRYDLSKMKQWGHSAFWWPQVCVGERACLFGRRPRPGDVLIDGDDVYAVVGEVDTPRDPGDQHFVDVKLWGSLADLPDSQAASNDTFGLIQ